MDDRRDETKEYETVAGKGTAGYLKGVLTGVFGTLFVVLLIGAVSVFWLQGRISFVGGNTEGDSAEVLNRTARAKIDQLTSLIEKTYYEDVDTEKLTEGIYKGLLSGLEDPYSAYYTAQEYQDLMISASAQYYGIGAVLRQNPDTGEVTIVKVYDNSPAQEAGLKSEDIIVQVEDIVARKMELSELVTHLRGEENSTVHLVIARTRESKEIEKLEMDVARARVDVPTVDCRMLTDEIGYIQIAEFGEATATDFERSVEELSNEGMKSLVIDLRDNPGGMMDSVTEILDYLLPEGLIVYTEDKQGHREEVNSDAERYLDCPMAILINGNSASCSEIFAGAIRDYKYGTLIGTTTYGKGVVQVVRRLPDKSAVKLTTAKYFTPKGENIHGTGIDPDIELQYKYNGKQGEEYDYMKDNQVRRAVKELYSLTGMEEQ